MEVALYYIYFIQTLLHLRPIVSEDAGIQNYQKPLCLSADRRWRWGGGVNLFMCDSARTGVLCAGTSLVLTQHKIVRRENTTYPVVLFVSPRADLENINS
jgi:hypothetical protein